MGFWSNLFSQIDDNVYNETKKEGKETQKWNDNLHMSMNYEEEFSNYLKSIGSNAVYISQVDESAASVRNQIDHYKRKIKEFLNLGGEGKYIYDVEELDEYIEVMKYLKSVGYIDRQEEFLGFDLYFARDTIEREQKEKALQRESEIVEIVGTDINSLSGVEFEKICQQLVENMGFETETTKASGDGGIDLIAYNYQPLLSGKYIIQCKRYLGSVGEPIIRDLYGVVMSERANKGILMTTGTFTKSAVNFADGKQIELISGEKLNSLLVQYNCVARDNCDEEEFDLSGENQICKIEEVFKNNPLDIEKYHKMINELSFQYNDKKCADLVIYLISEMCVLSFDEKLSIIPEINKYIFLYIDEKKSNENCKWLSYLFMMCCVQFSILSGEFCDAKIMFERLMQNKELLFTDSEFVEPNYTLEICESHTGIFFCLYDTFYNMIQLSNIVKDDRLKEYINQECGFNIVKSITRGTWEDSGESIDPDDQYAKYRMAHWNGELEALDDIYEVNRIYLISDYELEMYYDYAYENKMVNSLSPSSYKMEVLRNCISKNDELKYSDWYLSFQYNDETNFGKLYNLTSKIEKYNAEK